MSKVSRREFVRTAAAASTTFPLFTISGTKASGRVIGANETIRIGVAGVNGQGRHHARELAGLPNVKVSYLIDPDSRLFESRSGMVKEIGGNTPKCVQDIRQALDDPELDAVSVATPNHWHSLITIWACQAGKDVYVEKPLSHNVFEGRQCVAAAHEYGRIVQHGTQSRSKLEQAREIAAVQSGRYGKLLVSKGYCCKPRWSIGTRPVEPPPRELDFDLWLGPAAEQPFHRNLVHYNWHWFWETGNGEIGNQGVHQMDIARWAIQGATLPRRVWSLGGRFGYEDQGETPNMQLAVFEYDEALLVFEVRGLVGNDKPGNVPRRVDNEFHTTEGVIRQGKFYPRGSDAGEPIAEEEVDITPGGRFGSFVHAMRSRDPRDLNADVETGHYSSALCHLANISYQLGQAVPYEKASAALGDNKQVVESFHDLRDNLHAVGMNLEETTYRLGRSLRFDPGAETFIDDHEADALLTREYRAPFVVPDVV